MNPGKYIQRVEGGGWAVIQVLRPEVRVTSECGCTRLVKHEKLLAVFTGSGSKSRAIQAAGTNQEATR